MGKFSSVLLASDFDGTLTGSDGKIPQRNIDAIRYFISEGGHFTVSTGRTKIGFHNYSDEIINTPVILGNGAMAYDFSEEKIVFTNAVSYESAGALRQIITVFPFVGTELYSVDHKAYVLNPNEHNINHFKGLRLKRYTVADDIGEDMFPLVKCMLSVGEKTFEVQEYLKAIDLKGMKFIPTSGSFIELLSLSSGKGNALLQLADRLHINHRDAYAIGDASNDVDMLEAAAVGFVPSSSDSFALSAADKILCSSDEGVVADVIGYLEGLYG